MCLQKKLVAIFIPTILADFLIDRPIIIHLAYFNHCVATALDRQGNLIIEPLCKGRMTHKELERLYKGHIGENSILCTDSHNNMFPIT